MKGRYTHMEIIRTYTPDTDEFARLTTAARVLTAVSPKHITYTVEDTYFDYGQRWMWTTIIAHDNTSSFGSYQALCPRDYEKILLTDDMLMTLSEIRADKWWSDR